MTTPLPPWLIPPSPKQPHLKALGRQLAEMGVNTVCQSARCPNLGECFGRRTATFLIMGNVCTRDCRFCAVDHGSPAPLDPMEPGRVAEAARMLNLRHVVVTSVTRDDLPDGGAAHFVATIAALRDFPPPMRVEVLVPDFRGDRASLALVARAGPDVFGHNIETVPRLYPQVRPQADYARSLGILRMATELAAAMMIKSGLMVGLGESEDEVLGVLRDLRQAGVSAVTIGQYLQPAPKHLPVASYLPPETFRQYQEAARALGFAHVLSGPLVRSSYHAEDLVSPQTRGAE